MELKLSYGQLLQLRDLILDEIDRVGGYDQLSDELEDVLQQVLILKNEQKAKEQQK